jgi:hypothetical protein
MSDLKLSVGPGPDGVINFPNDGVIEHDGCTFMEKSPWTVIRSDADLPPFGKVVIARCNRGNWIYPKDQDNINVVVVWRREARREGNNLRDYDWDTFGPDSFFGQEIIEWMYPPASNFPSPYKQREQARQTSFWERRNKEFWDRFGLALHEQWRMIEMPAIPLPENACACMKADKGACAKDRRLKVNACQCQCHKPKYQPPRRLK